MRLENKVAVITGASRGIGFSVAEAFVREGAKIALCGSRQESAESAAAKLLQTYPNAEILPVGVDVTDSGAISDMVSRVVDKWGYIDVLVNNAGVTSAKQLFDMTDEDFDSVIRINLSGPFKCTREVAKIMRQRGGSIINTSSMVGTYGGKMQSAYSSSKFGINGLTKSCAKELGAYGIRVNAVAPGVVATDMMKNSVNEQMLSGLKQITPLGRAGEPKELAGAYVYLASDEASFTTGTILHVDGGIVM
ncbi:SDR family NAD(P)-dependent oxidoreductase [Oscillibacter ruminantium]|jgi:3-oxoacyl-[acyl-carrier protein] reductase/7-alpha-hydroxysteroid dehydrogenase|uniref:SDR family NAD(P)-dependent oxidoreductase n=1 Tax=Oscillibacter ruminantium TaxID=1263547 RepID=UPI0003129D10|nr:3-oxoacyl-ACP reductase family protein [Oscillibacter ruminantium]